ncbi:MULTISPECIES: hypothetical protein [unclassified Streptomyces]|uniref:hypothetical protein n=1 Tax=unclassified Streptomyces TaxID=2593676 RepID=UPI0007C56E74|nr:MULTISPECIES: hypothetical protein [unclassified Streptomyces]
MPLITEYSTTARPDRGIVEVYDSDAYLGDDEALQQSMAQVVAGNGCHLYLHSRQPDIDVQVTIRVWDTAQQPPADAEGTVPVSLESETAQLVVNQLTFGPAGMMDLPRPGVYEGHAAWSGRDATAAYYDTCLRRAVDEQWGAERIGAAWKQCSTAEQYTLDLWFVRDSEPEPDGEGDEWPGDCSHASSTYEHPGRERPAAGRPHGAGSA